jgi:hypothetical protein
LRIKEQAKCLTPFFEHDDDDDDHNSFTDTPRKEYETQEHNVVTGNMGFDLGFS